MMVTVAKSLDVPIKLVIPRADNPNQPGVAQFSMLGLGDIVLPGMMIGLALRYDLYRHYLALQHHNVAGDETITQDAIKKAKYVPPQKHWSSHFWTFSWFGSRSSVPSSVQTGSFSKVYFSASVIGYTIGMITTLVVMTWYKHAQPALLYLVPGVLLALGGTALVRGEVNEMWNFTEAEEVEGDNQEPSKSAASQSLFSGEKAERNEAKLKKGISKYVQEGESEDEGEKTEKSESGAKVEKLEKKFRRDKDHDLVFFAISRHAPLRRTRKETKSEPKYTAHEETEVERPGKRQRIG
jgi:minor histocompatibility antigen H13